MIKVCDMIMGGGKSSAAITYMNEHPDKKFIYITPRLDECDRIFTDCASLNFIEPDAHKGRGSKVRHTEELIAKGQNIATTHQAFIYYTDRMNELIKNQHYTLIVDEAVEMLYDLDLTDSDFKVLERSGELQKSDDGTYHSDDDSYVDGKFNLVLEIARTRKIFRFVDIGDPDSESGKQDKYSTMYSWLVPPEAFDSFDDVFVLTYLFRGSSMYAMLKIYRLDFKYIYVTRDKDGVSRFTDDKSIRYEPEYVKTLSSKIDIVENKYLNDVGNRRNALSASWMKNHTSGSKEIITLKNNIVNLYTNIWKGNDANIKTRMWSTYGKSKHKLKGKKYTGAFVPLNTRATNKYHNARYLVYACNVFANPFMKNAYRNHGADLNDDIYALSMMIQWIWRSAIRDASNPRKVITANPDDPYLIHLYLPSKRMRGLLKDWMKSLEEGGSVYGGDDTQVQ